VGSLVSGESTQATGRSFPSW